MNNNLYIDQKFIWTKFDKQGTVVLKAFTKSEICVEYNDKLVVKPISVIGTTLFPQEDPPNSTNKECKISKQSICNSIEEKLPNYTCKDCKIPKQGNCGGMDKEICKYFEPLVKISKHESDNWPAFGEATFLRLGGKLW